VKAICECLQKNVIQTANDKCKVWSKHIYTYLGCFLIFLLAMHVSKNWEHIAYHGERPALSLEPLTG